MPGVRTTRIDAGAVARAGRRRSAAASVRGERRLRAPARRARRVRARSPSRRATAGTDGCRLAAERAAVGQRRRRFATGRAPRRVGFEVAGLDPRRAQREVPVAVGQVERMPQRDRRAAALHLTRQRRARRPTSPRRPTRRRPSGTATSASAARCRRRTRRDRTRRRRPTRCGDADLRSLARRDAASRSRGAEAPSKAAASAIVFHPVQRHRCASSARSTSSRVASSAARRITMPGVQNPHWLRARRTNASAKRRCVAASSPSTVVTSRPATRRTGVTQATRGDPSTHTVQHPH